MAWERPGLSREAAVMEAPPPEKPAPPDVFALKNPPLLHADVQHLWAVIPELLAELSQAFDRLRTGSEQWRGHAQSSPRATETMPTARPTNFHVESLSQVQEVREVGVGPPAEAAAEADDEISAIGSRTSICSHASDGVADLVHMTASDQPPTGSPKISHPTPTSPFDESLVPAQLQPLEGSLGSSEQMCTLLRSFEAGESQALAGILEHGDQDRVVGVDPPAETADDDTPVDRYSRAPDSDADLAYETDGEQPPTGSTEISNTAPTLPCCEAPVPEPLWLLEFTENVCKPLRNLEARQPQALAGHVEDGSMASGVPLMMTTHYQKAADTSSPADMGEDGSGKSVDFLAPFRSRPAFFAPDFFAPDFFAPRIFRPTHSSPHASSISSRSSSPGVVRTLQQWSEGTEMLEDGETHSLAVEVNPMGDEAETDGESVIDQASFSLNDELELPGMDVGPGTVEALKTQAVLRPACSSEAWDALPHLKEGAVVPEGMLAVRVTGVPHSSLRVDFERDVKQRSPCELQAPGSPPQEAFPALTVEIQQLMAEEKRLVAGVAAVRYVSQLVQDLNQNVAEKAEAQRRAHSEREGQWRRARATADARALELEVQTGVHDDVLVPDCEAVNAELSGSSGEEDLGSSWEHLPLPDLSATKVPALAPLAEIGGAARRPVLQSRCSSRSPSRRWSCHSSCRDSSMESGVASNIDLTLRSERRRHTGRHECVAGAVPPASTESRREATQGLERSASGCSGDSGAGTVIKFQSHPSPEGMTLSPDLVVPAGAAAGAELQRSALAPEEDAGSLEGAAAGLLEQANYPQRTDPASASVPLSLRERTEANILKRQGSPVMRRRLGSHRRIVSTGTYSPRHVDAIQRSAEEFEAMRKAMQSLTPLRLTSTPEEPHVAPSSPLGLHGRGLLEGFFLVDMDADGVAEACVTWPEALRGGCFEKAVVFDGFCPNPEAFYSPETAGYGGEPFVFSLLETTLDPAGDPSGVLYGCVCSEEGGAHDPATEQQEASPSPAPGVLCLISKLPVFSLLFRVLGMLRGFDLRSHDGRHEMLLNRLNRTRLRTLVSDGIDVSDLVCTTVRFYLNLPSEPLGLWSAFGAGSANMPLGIVSQSFAQWQVAWGFEALLTRWGDLAGDTLAKLLACVLLEQKVLLLGDVPRISTMALVLRALLWPFRWLHPFLSAPPPINLLRMPLLEAPSPVFIALTELPREWGFQTYHQLPAEVVTGVLKHDYVYTSPALETPFGLKGGGIKLPAGRHAAYRKHVKGVRNRLAKDEIDMYQAVASVQETAESEVGRLASLIKSYSAAEVTEGLQAEEATPDGVSTCDVFLRKLRARCLRHAMDSQNFMRWLETETPQEAGDVEAKAFYQTFFQTQLCLDYLNEEIMEQTAAVVASSAPLTSTNPRFTTDGGSNEAAVGAPALRVGAPAPPPTA